MRHLGRQLASLPEVTLPQATVSEVTDVATVVDAMVAAGVAKSKGEARRLIEQGGVSVDETKVTDANMPIPAAEFVLHKGKKVHLKIVVK